MRPILFLLMLLPLAGCGLFADKETRTLRKSPDYRAGYQDGCNSAWSPDANKRHDDTVVRDDQQTMLVFRSSEDGRMAIPLSRVARLEELPCRHVERIGHELVVQYRGEIMPLLDLSQLLGEGASTSRIGSARTGDDGGTPSSASHAVSCSDELTYTMRPSPTQACAAAHIGQCSPEVNTVAPARSAAVMLAAAQRASSNSGCLVASPMVFSRLRSSARTRPSAATRTEPNGWSPASTASAASSTQRRRCGRSSGAMPPGLPSACEG